MWYTEGDYNRLAEQAAAHYTAANGVFYRLLGARLQEMADMDEYELREYIAAQPYLDDVAEIEAAIEKATQDTAREITALALLVAAANYGRYSEQYLAVGAYYMPFSENIPLQSAVGAAIQDSIAGVLGIPQTSAFKIMGFDGKPQATTLSQGYQWYIDQAGAAIRSGGDYYTEIRTIIRDYSRAGIQTAHYPSGYARRMDSTVRQDVLAAMRNTNQASLDEIGRELGADGVEISAHFGCAPDHIDGQGGVYTNAEFDELQGSLDRQFGEFNCYHTWAPVIVGVSEPRYTQEYLDQLKKSNEEGAAVDGRHYTVYEGMQHQRQLETSIRANKEWYVAAKAAGDTEGAATVREYVREATDEYKYFSQQAGLDTKPDRIRVEGYR